MTSVVLIALLASCTPSAQPTLAGFYESRATSRGGIGYAIELKADGTAVTGSTVIVNMKWRVVNGHLLLDDKDSGAFRLEGEQLSRRPPTEHR